MSLIVYPSNLKLPLLSGYKLSQNSNLLRTEMESGTARVRQKFKSVPTVMQASWRLSSENAVVFEGFVTHALNNAVNWFVMPVLTPAGVTEHDVRFIKNPLEDVSYSSGVWEYSGQIEIKKRKVTTEERTAELILEPNTTDEFVTGVSDALDNYQG